MPNKYSRLVRRIWFTIVSNTADSSVSVRMHFLLSIADRKLFNALEQDSFRDVV